MSIRPNNVEMGFDNEHYSIGETEFTRTSPNAAQLKPD